MSGEAPVEHGQLKALNAAAEVTRHAMEALDRHIAALHDWQQIAVLEKASASPEAA